ncbi:MYND-type domain-containing protein [Mycena chlorophos]|uniref:MYND-type domain-containing protein n=1 Tax=Mycena chlorophos TaxID=658473 RepID=A0A8H6WAU9_MYCCL|nr:MYND-type domain-containing protein [Mycena chlorophos]
MHPSLAISALYQLPVSLRQQALDAAKGSPAAFEAVLDRVKTLTPGIAIARYLPVFYANIDLARVPQGSELGGDNWNPAFRTCACCKIPPSLSPATALRMVFDCLRHIPNAGQLSLVAANDLWHRIFHWLDFFAEHSQDGGSAMMAAWIGIPHSEVLGYLAGVLSYFARQPNRRDIAEKYACHVDPVVVVLWAELAAVCHASASSGVVDVWADYGMECLFSFLGYFYSDCRVVGRLINCFRVDHDLRLIATILAQQLPHAIDARIVYRFTVLVYIARNLTERLDGAIAFADAGGLALSIRNLRAISTTFLGDPSTQLIDDIVRTIFQMFTARPMYAEVVHAAQSDLWAVMEMCGRAQDRMRLGDASLEQLSSLITTTLAKATLHYPVIRALQQAPLSKRLDLNKLRDAFKHSRHFTAPSFDRCMKLLAERAADFERFSDAAYVELRGCDNVKCGAIRPRSEFKRCGQCSIAFYCSRACQKFSWREGGHRKLCQPESNIVFQSNASVQLSRRSDAFLRYLVQQYYHKSKLDLLLKQARFIKETGRTDFVMEFRYTEGDPVDVRFRVIDKRIFASGRPGAEFLWPQNAPPLSQCVVIIDGGGNDAERDDGVGRIEGPPTNVIERAYLLRRAPGVSEELAKRLRGIVAEMEDGEGLRDVKGRVHERIRELSALDVVETIC